MLKLCKLLALGLLLYGCGMTAAQRQQEACRQVAAIYEECRQRLLTGQVVSDEAQLQCGNDRAREILAESGLRNMGLIDLHFEQDLVHAQKVDKSEIAEAEAKLQAAEMKSCLKFEKKGRKATTRRTNVMESEANPEHGGMQ